MDIKQRYEKNERYISESTITEQNIALVLDVVYGEKVELIDELVEILNVGAEKINQTKKMIKRAIMTKEAADLIIDLEFEQVRVERKKKERKCVICQSKQDFEKEPIIGCERCNTMFDGYIKDEKMMLSNEEKKKYKRISYLQKSYILGQLGEAQKELSYIWFGRILSEKEILLELTKKDNETKTSMKRLNEVVQTVLKEKKNRVVKKRKCHICGKEVEKKFAYEKFYKCDQCHELILSKTQKHHMHRNTEEFKRLYMNYYIKEVLDKGKMTALFYKHLKERESDYNLHFNSKEQLKEKVEKYLMNVGKFELPEREEKSTVAKMVVTEKTEVAQAKEKNEGLKEKKEEIIGLKEAREELKLLLLMDKNKKIKEELQFYLFEGDVGTGRTYAAQMWANVLAKEKIIASEELVEVCFEELFDGSVLVQERLFKIIDKAQTNIVLFDMGVYQEDDQEHAEKVFLVNKLIQKQKKNHKGFVLYKNVKNSTIKELLETKKTISFKNLNALEQLKLLDLLANKEGYQVSNYARIEFREKAKETQFSTKATSQMVQKMIEKNVLRMERQKKAKKNLLTKEDYQKSLKEGM